MCSACCEEYPSSHSYIDMFRRRIRVSFLHDSASVSDLCLMLQSVQVSLGYYEKEVDAARAYDAESLRLRGPSGHINLPESRALIEAHLLQNEGASNATSAGSLSLCFILQQWHSGPRDALP